MARASQNDYGSEGSVPNSQPIDGSGAHPLSVQASPADFGAQIGAGIEKIGGASEDLAAKYGNMVNETLMTNADANFATKVGKIKADYTSKTGMDAYSSFPQYQADIQQAFQDSRANLPMGAQHGFDMLGARTMANHIADGSTYATSQLKEANRDSYSSLTNTSLQALLDPSIASNPERSQYHMDTINYATQAQIDSEHPGLKTDPKTGTIDFDESTPEGRNLKTNFQQRLDANLGQAYVNRYDTLAKQDVFGAYDAYQQDRGNIPKAGQVALDASFAPRILAANSQIATGNTLTSAEQSHFDLLTNPSTSAINWTMQHEGGFVSNDSGKGPTKFGINQEANPGVDVASLTQDQAAKIMHDKYWVGVGADSMSPAMASVAFDTAVNMGVGKARELVSQANGDPQKLIDLRRDEYNRLAAANPEKYGQNLDGWNKRLDDLQVATEGKKTYATNENGAPLSLADYYRTNSQDVLAKGDAYAEQQMPGDLALKRAVRDSLSNYMSKTIANENAVHVMDNRNVMKAINGDLTKGKPPETEEELRSIPGVAPTLDKIATQDPKFYESIPTLIGKVAKRNDVTNSPNGYDTLIRTLQPYDDTHPNAIRGQDQLDKLLGRSDGTGINMKDYNDAKPATELPPEIKEPLLKHMQEITNANGNVDGKGQQRAVQWYGQVMNAWKQNSAQGDKGMSVADFASNIGQPNASIAAPPTPSRMTQISNWAKEMTGLGHVTMKNSDGTMGLVPAANVEKALKLGYTKVE